MLGAELEADSLEHKDEQKDARQDPFLTSGRVNHVRAPAMCSYLIARDLRSVLVPRSAMRLDTSTFIAAHSCLLLSQPVSLQELLDGLHSCARAPAAQDLCFRQQRPALVVSCSEPIYWQEGWRGGLA
jgi:hypothetical protein